MRAAIYARVSSAAQRDKHTIENQLRVLPAFVTAQGWTLAGTYTDDGRSAKAGKLDARDGFARLVRDAEAGKFELLVVVDVDRLTRTDSIEERALILGPFQRLGIDIVTPSGGRLDMRTMFGELWITIQALGAAEENRKRAERIKAGKLRAIAEGRKPAGPTPYGLAYDRASGSWSIDPVTSAIVIEIFKRVIAGDSCMAIADDLHKRGAPAPRGPWERHKVWVIVRSRYVIGEWTADKRRRLIVTVPAILDEATWSAAQDELIAHGKRGLRKTRHVYLLEALAVCGLCGSPMAIRSSAPGRGNYVTPAAYVCRARKLARIGEVRCPAPIVPVADADARVWEKVRGALENPELAAELGRRARSAADNRRDWTADAVGHRAHLARLDKTEAGLLGRYQRGLVTDSGLDVALADLQRSRAAVRSQLATAEKASQAHDTELVVNPADWLRAIRVLCAEDAPETRQRVVRTVVEPGATFDGHLIKMTLSVEEASPVDRASAHVLGVVPGYRRSHEKMRVSGLRIRLVA